MRTIAFWLPKNVDTDESTVVEQRSFIQRTPVGKQAEIIRRIRGEPNSVEKQALVTQPQIGLRTRRD